MKNLILSLLTATLLCSSCAKTIDALADKIAEKPSPDFTGFTQYTIKSGSHYADGNNYKTIETSELKFAVKFDSSAIYKTKDADNQYDINKLYGFSDNGAQHHQFSARIGWRWSGGALRLFGYVYNDGVRIEKELATISIGVEVNCIIKVAEGQYLFTVGNQTDRLPRAAPSAMATGYQLYPYFGGDEPAPHDIRIWIKHL